MLGSFESRLHVTKCTELFYTAKTLEVDIETNVVWSRQQGDTGHPHTPRNSPSDKQVPQPPNRALLHNEGGTRHLFLSQNKGG